VDGEKGYDSRNGNHRYALVVNCGNQMDFYNYVPTKIRSLHVFDCGEIQFSLFSKSLRVLELSKFSSGNFLASMGKLKQLRYLGARGMQHESVPEHIFFANVTLARISLRRKQLQTVPDAAKQDLANQDHKGENTEKH
jgi:hypothetical protein